MSVKIIQTINKMQSGPKTDTKKDTIASDPTTCYFLYKKIVF